VGHEQAWTGVGAIPSNPGLLFNRYGYASGVRAGQGTGGVGDLDRPGLVSARSKCVANYVRSARIGDTGSTFMNKIDDKFTGGLNDG
jgi:hypothetical protein